MSADQAFATARAVAAEFARLPCVTAVALGGSRAAGLSDDRSDLDLYVYADQGVPVTERAALIEARALGGASDIDNRFWEWGDEWIEAETGVHVDVMHRSLRWIEDDLERVLTRHEASLGYTTALWHNVRLCIPLFDREERLAGFKARAARPYPVALARAIISKNRAVMRGNLASYLPQIERAVARGDRVAVNHRLTGLLASYFDVLFALNLATHPGEKNLIPLAEKLPLRPPNMRADIEAVLRLATSDPRRLASRIETLLDGLDSIMPAFESL